MLVGDGQRLHLAKGDLAHPELVHDARVDLGKLDLAAHRHGADAEPVGHLLGCHAVILDQLAEGLDLIGDMHVVPHGVLRKGDFRVVVLVEDQDRDQEFPGPAAPNLVGECTQRRQAPRARGDLMLALVVQARPQKAKRRDAAGVAGTELRPGRLAESYFIVTYCFVSTESS